MGTTGRRPQVPLLAVFDAWVGSQVEQWTLNILKANWMASCKNLTCLVGFKPTAVKGK